MEDANVVTDQEMQDARRWRDDMFAALSRTESRGHDVGPIVSLDYGGEQAAAQLRNWRRDGDSEPLANGTTRRFVERRDPTTGLAVRVEITEYADFPVVEWVVRLRNTSDVETPILSDVRSMDILLPLQGDAFLNYHTGDHCAADGYEPHRVELGAGSTFSFAPDGGRPTNQAWPYYNVECPQAERGVNIVIGWSGQWCSSFRRIGARLAATGGQERTHFKLLPGEEVRTPLTVLLFYRGDRMRSQNVWRRWMMAHNMPRPAGELPQPLRPASSSVYFDEMTRANEESQKYFIDGHVEKRSGIDCWWMDAGWYPCEGHWHNTGTWEPDPVRFPNGLRAVSDHARSKGLKTLVWFEPERVARDTWLDREHPEWLFDVGGSSKLLDVGNPEVRSWLIDHVDRLLTEQGIDIYRQDFNIDPLPFWRANDADDRQGISEIRYVEGYLAYWDALLQRRPDLLIDSCASGGRRNDLETMRRAVPLHKTDYNYADLPVKQAFHQMLPMWIPYFGSPLRPLDKISTYGYRSAHAQSMATSLDVRREDVDYALAQQLSDEWRRVVGYYYGDYYPLTLYSRDEASWIAWQYDRPDLGEGVFYVFRRAECPEDTLRVKLCGLEPNGRYRFTDADTGATHEGTGDESMTRGLTVPLPDAPCSALCTYEKIG